MVKEAGISGENHMARYKSLMANYYIKKYRVHLAMVVFIILKPYLKWVGANSK
jgi:hypothetical protein